MVAEPAAAVRDLFNRAIKSAQFFAVGCLPMTGAVRAAPLGLHDVGQSAVTAAARAVDAGVTVQEVTAPSCANRLLRAAGD